MQEKHLTVCEGVRSSPRSSSVWTCTWYENNRFRFPFAARSASSGSYDSEPAKYRSTPSDGHRTQAVERPAWGFFPQHRDSPKGERCFLEPVFPGTRFPRWEQDKCGVLRTVPRDRLVASEDSLSRRQQSDLIHNPGAERQWRLGEAASDAAGYKRVQAALEPNHSRKLADPGVEGCEGSLRRRPQSDSPHLNTTWQCRYLGGQSPWLPLRRKRGIDQDYTRLKEGLVAVYCPRKVKRDEHHRTP